MGYAIALTSWLTLWPRVDLAFVARHSTDKSTSSGTTSTEVSWLYEGVLTPEVQLVFKPTSHVLVLLGVVGDLPLVSAGTTSTQSSSSRIATGTAPTSFRESPWQIGVFGAVAGLF